VTGLRRAGRAHAVAVLQRVLLAAIHRGAVAVLVELVARHHAAHAGGARHLRVRRVRAALVARAAVIEVGRQIEALIRAAGEALDAVVRGRAAGDADIAVRGRAHGPEVAVIV